MRITSECIPCLVKRISFEIDRVDPGLKGKVLPRISKMLEEAYVSGSNSALAATRVHEVAYRALGCDPYAELKRRSTDVALSLLPRARKFISGSRDKFRAKVLVSIAGNALDFGIPGSASSPEALVDEFDSLLGSDFIDQSRQLKKEAKALGKVLFLSDNCGEVILDRFLVEELSKFASVSIVAKDLPILTDATIEDVKHAGLDTWATQVLGTGPFAVGFDPIRLPTKVRALMKGSLIVSKGMANYEALPRLPFPVKAYLLMRVKCVPIARSLKVKKGLNLCMKLSSSGTPGHRV